MPAVLEFFFSDYLAVRAFALDQAGFPGGIVAVVEIDRLAVKLASLRHPGAGRRTNGERNEERHHAEPQEFPESHFSPRIDMVSKLSREPDIG
jgi:hypothetical protein